MCDVAKELSNATNSVSNALGTDGSKNGLLNDPVSMGLVAAGAAIATGGVSLGADLGAAAVADVGATAAAADGALVPLEVIMTSGSGAVASVVADSAAASSWGLPSWLNWGIAADAAKIAAPALLTSYSQGNALSNQKELLSMQATQQQKLAAMNGITGQSIFGPAAGSKGAGVSVNSSNLFMPLAIIAGAILYLKAKN